jgi:PAS domain S-box-containing protein
MNRQFLTLFVCLASCSAAWTEELWEFNLLLKPEGIPYGEVSDIVEDDEGAIWVATRGDGLYRLHGTERQHYQESDGLADNWIFSLAFDGRGSLWIATGHGLCRLHDGELHTFGRDVFPSLVDLEFVYVDLLDSDTLCAATSEGEVVFLDLSASPFDANAWSRIATADQFDGGTPSKMVRLHNGHLLLCLLGRGLAKFDGTRWELIAGGRPDALLSNREEGEPPFVWVFSGKRSIKYDGKTLEEAGLVGEAVTTAAYSPRGNVFVGTSKGVALRTDENWRSLDLGRKVGRPFVRVIFFDSRGRMWLGTNGGLVLGTGPHWGADFRTHDGKRVLHIVQDPEAGRSLAAVDEENRFVRFDNEIWQIECQLASQATFSEWWFFAPHDTLWGINGEQLCEFSVDDGALLRTLDLQRLPGDRKLFRTSKGQLWLLTSSGIFQLEDNQWLSLPDDPSYAREAAYTVLEIGENEYFVGVSSGIEHWRDGRMIRNIIKDRDSSWSIDGRVLRRLDDGTYLIGTFGHGIHHYDGESLQPFPVAGGGSSSHIADIHEASNGTLWIAFLYGGVASYRNGMWATYFHGQGLPNDPIVSIHEDSQGKIWLTSQDMGVFSYEPTHEAPETRIEAAPNSILSHDFGVFTFAGHDAWEHTPRQNLLYSWRVVSDNFGMPWSEFAHATMAVTPRLSPGEYAFEVRAADEEHMIDATPASTRFRVEPPFWQNPGFLAPIGALGLLALGTCLIALRMRALRRAAEKKQRASDERLRSVIEDISGVVYQAVIGIESDELFISGALQEITGYPAEEFFKNGTRKMLSLVLPEDRRVVKQAWRDSLSQDGPYYLEFRIKDAHGRIRWLSYRGHTVAEDGEHPRYVEGVALDITDRKEADEELRQREQEIREMALFAELNPAPVLRVDSEGGILSCNEATVQILGEAARQGVALKSILPPLSDIDFGRLSRSGEVMIREYAKVGDAYYQFVIQGVPHLCLVHVYGSDISERKKAQEEARTRQQQLIQADKMVSLGTLVAGVAHEISNPNTYIKTNAELFSRTWEQVSVVLDEYYRDNGDFALGGLPYSTFRDKAPTLCSSILEGSERIRKIVQELGEFTRSTPSDVTESVEVNQVVHAAITILSNMLKKSTMRFSLDLSDDLPKIFGSFQRLEQVVLNVLQNACQALPNSDKGIIVSTLRGGAEDGVQIVVRDEGGGIPEEALTRIQDPFFSTKRASGGTGLGLSISSSIIQEHGGTLDFVSEIGKGTAVTIWLPLPS